MNPYCLKSHFTLFEAAAAIHDLTQPSRSDDFALQSTQRDLIDAIKSGELKATVATAFRTHTIPGLRIVGEPDRTERIPNGTDWSRTTIPRADLLAWCEQRGIHPILLFPDSPPAPKSAATDDPPDYRTPALDALRAAITEFWLHHDLSRPPKKQDIIQWLIKHHGMTPAMARNIDQVIRPESRRKGGNTCNN